LKEKEQLTIYIKTYNFMESTPLFSLIVPVYNSEVYLDKCVSSILKQSYGEFELILVNDGSKDKSLEICQIYSSADNRIVLIDQVNQGVSVARNSGIKAARGEYVCFVDSDDFIDGDYLKHFVKEIEQTKSDLIVGGFIKYFGENNLNNARHYVSFCQGLKVIPRLEQQNLLSGPFAKCFRRDIIVHHGLWFDKTFSFGEDAIFNLAFVLQINSLSVIDYCGYFYVQTEGESLVKRKYSFEKTKEFAELITRYRYELSRKYQLLEGEYISFIEKERTLYIIGAIRSMYNKSFKKDFTERISILKEETPKLRLDLLPPGIYYSLVRASFRAKGYPIKDLLFKVLF